MSTKSSLLVLLIIFRIAAASAQPKIYPTNWWVGMKDPNLQLMVHQQDIGNASITAHLLGKGQHGV